MTYDSTGHDTLEKPSRELFSFMLLFIIFAELDIAAPNSFYTLAAVQFEQVKNCSSNHCYMEKRC